MKKFTKLYALALLAIGFTSCLNDEMVEDQKYGMINEDAYKVIEIPTASNSLALELKNEPLEIDSFINVHLSASQVAQEDIKVTLQLEPVESPMVSLPTDAYTLPEGLVVTIPKGSRDGYLPIVLNTNKLDASSQYGFNVSVASVDKPGYTISGNYGNTDISVVVKNRWDGVYEVKNGTLTDFASPSLSHINNFLSASGDPPMQWEFRTISATEVLVYDNYFFGGIYYPITSGNSYSRYGDFAVIFKFDPATNKIVEVRNYFGEPAPSNTRSAELDPSGVNAWDPTTKDVSVKYWLIQPSSIANPPHIRAAIFEEMEYVGPRD